MMQNPLPSSLRTPAGAGVLLSCLLATPMGAQETGGVDSRFSIDVSAQAERNADLNPGGSAEELSLRTTLGYGLSLSTPVQSLDFGVRGTYAVSDGADGFEAPTLTLGYSYNGARQGITASASYREADVSDLSLGLDDSGTLTLYEGTGTRGFGTLSLGLDGGRDRPLRYNVNLSANAVRYTGTNLTDYYDSDTRQAGIGLEADLSPLATLKFDASYKTYEAEDSDATQRDTSQATIGADLRVNQVTSLSFSLGRSRIETEDIGGRTVESGMIGGVSLTREDQVGAYRLSYERSLTESGNRDTLRVARDQEFATGKLSASLGVTRGEDDKLTWVSAVDLSMERPRDTLGLSLNRSVTTDDEGADVTVTRASAGWSHLVSESGSLALDFSTRFTEEAINPDRERYDVTVAWNHELRRDVILSAGASMRLAKEDGAADARSEQLFLTLSRSFSGRP